MLVSVRVPACVYVGIVFTRARPYACVCARAFAVRLFAIACIRVCPDACVHVLAFDVHMRIPMHMSACARLLFGYLHLRVCAFVQRRVSMYQLLTCPAVYPRCSWA